MRNDYIETEGYNGLLCTNNKEVNILIYANTDKNPKDTLNGFNQT